MARGPERFILAGLHGLGRALAQLSALALLVMTFVVTYGVAMRYVFNSAQNWTDELATYCLAAITFLGLAFTLQSGAHIRIDLVSARLPPRPRRVLDVVAHAVGLGFAILLLLGCYDVVENFHRRGTLSISGLRVALFWPSLVLVIGAAAFLLAMAARTLTLARELARGHGEGGDFGMTALAATVALMLALMLGGVWVAASLGLAGAFALDQMLSFDRMVSVMGKMAWQQSTSFILIALPLFVLMGEILLQAGLMTRIYEAASKIVSGLPGGLLQTNIAASTIFAACTGSSLASAATIGSVGYPAVARRGYDRKLALGSIAAGGTLGILIPPSIIFIVYGGLAEVSIGALFLAGVLPGILLASSYSVYIAVCALLRPAAAPRERAGGFGEMLRALASLWQVALLVVVVLGGIYGGIASPTEVAAVASALALLLAAANRSLTLAGLWTACLNTVRQTSMILLVVAMAKVLSLALIYGQVPTLAAEWVDAAGAAPATVVLALLALYVVLGMFFDGISMMVVTVPFVAPIMQALGVDLIWLGVLICMTIEVGLLTPPVGLNLYVMQGATGEPFRTIMLGSMPFVGCQALAIALVFLFPEIATILPQQLS